MLHFLSPFFLAFSFVLFIPSLYWFETFLMIVCSKADLFLVIGEQMFWHCSLPLHFPCCHCRPTPTATDVPKDSIHWTKSIISHTHGMQEGVRSSKLAMVPRKLFANYKRKGLIQGVILCPFLFVEFLAVKQNSQLPPWPKRSRNSVRCIFFFFRNFANGKGVKVDTWKMKPRDRRTSQKVVCETSQTLGMTSSLVSSLSSVGSMSAKSRD